MAHIVKNKEVILISYTNEGSVTEDHLKVRETQLDINALKEGEVVLQNLWASVDPYLRLSIMQTPSALYSGNSKLDQPIKSFMIGKVVASCTAGFEVGDVVLGTYQVSENIIVAGSSLTKLDTNLAKPSDYLGLLGHIGFTAWIGLVLIGNPKPGDQVLVSAAAGAVGLVAGQLAKIKGCRVVGSTGSDEKVRILKEEFGFHEAFNYKTETDWDAALSKYFPRGIDIYFDNVGGKMLEAVLDHINMNARIPLSGMISQYNLERTRSYGVRNLMNLIVKCANMKGFVVPEYLNYKGDFMKEMGGYMREGKIKGREDVKEGIDSFLEALNSLLSGGNIGKALVQITPA